ncbi:hypothetical protein ACTXT7_005768 [Hymenolepis weldensis]
MSAALARKEEEGFKAVDRSDSCTYFVAVVRLSCDQDKQEFLSAAMRTHTHTIYMLPLLPPTNKDGNKVPGTIRGFGVGHVPSGLFVPSSYSPPLPPKIAPLRPLSHHFRLRSSLPLGDETKPSTSPPTLCEGSWCQPLVNCELNWLDVADTDLHSIANCGLLQSSQLHPLCCTFRVQYHAEKDGKSASLDNALSEYTCRMYFLQQDQRIEGVIAELKADEVSVM